MNLITLPNFFKNVTAAGTPEPLVATTATDLRKIMGPARVRITARKNKTTANTGAVYIGGRNAQSEVLLAQERWEFSVKKEQTLDLHEIFIDAATNGDGVSVTILQS